MARGVVNRMNQVARVVVSAIDESVFKGISGPDSISLFAFLLAVLATPRWFFDRFESMGLPSAASAIAGFAAGVLLAMIASRTVAALEEATSRWINRRWINRRWPD